MAILKRDNINTISTIILILTAIFISTTILSSNTYATSASASVTVPDACTLVSTLNTPHTATLSPGTSTGYGNAGGVDGIGQTTLKVTCNDSLGFAIYAIGYTEDTFGNTNLVSNTKNNGVSTYTIATGTNTSGSNSNWAMQINAVSGSFAPTIQNSFDSSNYHNVPTTYTMVAKRTSSTMNPSDPSTQNTGSSITTTYAAYISTNQAPDTYTGKVKYTMVHPNTAGSPAQPLAPTDCPANKICYAPNADDIVGSMDSISDTKIAKSATAGVQTTLGHNSTNITSNSTPTLITPNYSRAGYGFAGWSTDYDAASTYNNDHNANIIIYGPNQTITFATDGTGDADVSTNGLILYPVWVVSAGTIQDWSGCSSLTPVNYDSTTGLISATLSSVTALTDQRDGNVYTVARLADGNCWMTENLRIDAEATRGNANQALAQGYGDGTANNYGKFIGLADSENNFTEVTANSIYYTGAQSGTASIDVGTTNYPKYRIPHYNNDNTNRSLEVSYNARQSFPHAQWYGYGNIYNWSSAIASTNYYYDPTTIDSNGNTSETAGTSICPHGWKLPYGRNEGNGITSGGFSYLDQQMGGTGEGSFGGGTSYNMSRSLNWRKFPNNFVFSGSTGIAGSRSSAGFYWSSTARGNNGGLGSYMFWMSGAAFYPGDSGGNRYSGVSVRCLAGS